MIDPRGSVIQGRLAGIGRVAAFCSAKGGVGKTLCTAVAGVALAARGRKVGILDLDFQGSTAHLFLGVKPRMPAEEKGILPLSAAENLWLMSAAIFAGDRALALRGPEISDAILELLAVTRWGALDVLLIDMPPGIGEEVLDLARLVPRMEALVVSTPSAASTAVVERLLSFLAEMKVAVTGLIANMVRADSEPVRRLAARFGVPFAGCVDYEPGLEQALGSPRKLGDSRAAAALVAALKEAGL
jgi:ATP-binding protein involved in chromosome partitioning